MQTSHAQLLFRRLHAVLTNGHVFGPADGLAHSGCRRANPAGMSSRLRWPGWDTCKIRSRKARQAQLVRDRVATCTGGLRCQLRPCGDKWTKVIHYEGQRQPLFSRVRCHSSMVGRRSTLSHLHLSAADNICGADLKTGLGAVEPQTPERTGQ